MKSQSYNIPIRWVKKNPNSWLAQQTQGNIILVQSSIYTAKIEDLAHQTNQLGPQLLWDGYGKNNIAGPTRMPDGVRTTQEIGNLYTGFVQKLRPEIIVEFGTAFGVSGMYFLAGLELNQIGKLLTFEPNNIWRELAIRNLAQIGTRFYSISGTFEENIDLCTTQDERINLAFIDAIHTREFVLPQLEIVLAKSSNQAIILLDDINFSDNMRKCWNELSNEQRFLASAELGTRVGFLELP